MGKNFGKGQHIGGKHKAKGLAMVKFCCVQNPVKRIPDL
jgi:hypothetical protein